jgi:hypothetical protein
MERDTMKHRILRFLAVALLAVSGFGLVATSTALATQNADCAGIEEYIAELEAAGAEMDATMPQSDESNMESWSSEDFSATAEVFEAAQETFSEIDPPAAAEDYHALLIEQLGTFAQMFDTMATTGIFGAFMFIDQIDTMEAEANAAIAELEAACGVEIDEALGTDGIVDDTDTSTTEVIAETSSDESDDTPLSGGAGTRENPIPFGQTARIHPDWEMTVVSVTPDAAELIAGEGSFIEPPTAGYQYFVATVRLTYVGETSDTFFVSDLSAVGQSAVGYNQFDDYCGMIPNELPSRELFTGGTIEGNVCWIVAAVDVDSLVLYDNYGPSEERVYLSLVPDGATGGTPVASQSFVGAVKDAVATTSTPEAAQG